MRRAAWLVLPFAVGCAHMRPSGARHGGRIGKPVQIRYVPNAVMGTVARIQVLNFVQDIATESSSDLGRRRGWMNQSQKTGLAR
ncbi:hypothetical protein GGE07_004192 [Sinorhizobium terangae]|nr:hypothetical protein [Sinorhizobium terangae]